MDIALSINMKSQQSLPVQYWKTKTSFLICPYCSTQINIDEKRFCNHVSGVSSKDKNGERTIVFQAKEVKKPGRHIKNSD